MLSPLGDPACGGPGFADGQPVFTGTSLLDGWSTFSASLSAYANQRVRLRFPVGSDGATVQNGWFLDDIQATNALLPSLCTISGLPSKVAAAPSPPKVRLRKPQGGLATP